MNWNPFAQYGQEFDEQFKKFFHGLPMRANEVIVPAMDIYVHKDNLIVEMPLPGIDPAKVSIEVDDNNMLTVKGKVEKRSEVDDKNYYRQETKIGSFYRSVALPPNLNSVDAKADYEGGVLKISFPKNPESKPQQIKISAPVKKLKK